ncbi:MAG: Holliday junction branch migration protein RuvA [Candidatus Eisenbacteria bacterium]|uniref:Holliday junction branch migration complex subunit RuvA n=1 Tax=Eiseniibacteriota bacterium TaxID=2212470 RepID=A0A9D6QK28_UNCEI|nr:Holliday junction branch migration protein RuvA [Candidatus Eisenbacteria bacterium]MBI3539870.1 Holliday junction branch migration protein RuvA [Candidatus Eisenbacteria bacterium]
MIASLRGTLAEKGAGDCVVEAGGVGYRVQVSTHTAAALPDPGTPVFLLTHQVVREDALMLFGFADAEERRLFELLITVSGVGPKVALAVLSGLKPQALARAIRDENLAGLVAIPGVGRKTAERLVVELRDKLDVLAAAGGAPAAPAAGARGVLPRSERFDDAVAALVRLGYSAAQAQDVVRRVAEDGDGASLEDLVRRALARLGKAAATVR